MLNVKSKYLCPAPTPAGGFEVAVFSSTFFKRKSFGISIFVSKFVKRVYGIEIVDEAINQLYFRLNLPQNNKSI